MNNFTGRLYRNTSLRNGGRKAGIGTSEDDYGDESGPGKTSMDRGSCRMPNDKEAPENLNGPCIVVQPAREKQKPRLAYMTYEEARLKYFREQLRLANIRLDYAVRHHYPETVCADRGDAVSFYSDILKILEGKIND